MKIILAPDSFKGTYSAGQVCDAFVLGVKKTLPEAEIVKLPLADGGEGTLEALLEARNGELRSCLSHDPLGREIRLDYGILPGGEALIEMARSSGLALLNGDERNPWIVGTYGLGLVIKTALDQGIKSLTITLGGSATVDGGVGMARALGYCFFDSKGTLIEKEGGQILSDIARIDSSNVDQQLASLKVRALCDVRNVLLGPLGAARVFAPQKGADQEQVELLEKGMRNLSRRIKKDLSKDVEKIEGGGAAGGLGAAVAAFLGGELIPGIEYVLQTLDFQSALKGTSLVITGEGSFDAQSMGGKVVSGVLQMSAEQNVPVAIVCGRKGEVPQSVRVFSGEDLAGPRDAGALVNLNDLATLAAEAVRSVKQA